MSDGRTDEQVKQATQAKGYMVKVTGATASATSSQASHPIERSATVNTNQIYCYGFSNIFNKTSVCPPICPATQSSRPTPCRFMATSKQKEYKWEYKGIFVCYSIVSHERFAVFPPPTSMCTSKATICLFVCICLTFRVIPWKWNSLEYLLAGRIDGQWTNWMYGLCGWMHGLFV